MATWTSHNTPLLTERHVAAFLDAADKGDTLAVQAALQLPAHLTTTATITTSCSNGKGNVGIDQHAHHHHHNHHGNHTNSIASLKARIVRIDRLVHASTAQYGYTPIISAARGGHLRIVQMLLQAEDFAERLKAQLRTKLVSAQSHHAKNDKEHHAKHQSRTETARADAAAAAALGPGVPASKNISSKKKAKDEPALARTTAAAACKPAAAAAAAVAATQHVATVIGGEDDRNVVQTTTKPLRHYSSVHTPARQTGNSPLLYAAAAGYLDICKLLTQHGADPLAAAINGDLPVHWAAIGGKHTYPVLAFLLKRDPNTVLYVNETKVSTLHCACRSNNPESVELVLRNMRLAFDTEKKKKDDECKQQMQQQQQQQANNKAAAAQESKTRMKTTKKKMQQRLLVSRNTFEECISAPNAQGHTALHATVEAGSLPSLRLLIAAGAQVPHDALARCIRLQADMDTPETMDGIRALLTKHAVAAEARANATMEELAAAAAAEITTGGNDNRTSNKKGRKRKKQRKKKSKTSQQQQHDVKLRPTHRPENAVVPDEEENSRVRADLGMESALSSRMRAAAEGDATAQNGEDGEWTDVTSARRRPTDRTAQRIELSGGKRQIDTIPANNETSGTNIAIRTHHHGPHALPKASQLKGDVAIDDSGSVCCVGHEEKRAGAILCADNVLDDRAEALNISARHILGHDLRDLSAEQLDCVMESLAKLMDRVRGAQRHLQRHREYDLLTELSDARRALALQKVGIGGSLTP